MACESVKFLIKAFCPYYFNARNWRIILRFIVFTHFPPQWHQNLIIIPCVLSERKNIFIIILFLHHVSSFCFTEGFKIICVELWYFLKVYRFAKIHWSLITNVFFLQQKVTMESFKTIFWRTLMGSIPFLEICVGKRTMERLKIAAI